MRITGREEAVSYGLQQRSANEIWNEHTLVSVLWNYDLSSNSFPWDIFTHLCWCQDMNDMEKLLQVCHNNCIILCFYFFFVILVDISDSYMKCLVWIEPQGTEKGNVIKWQAGGRVAVDKLRTYMRMHREKNKGERWRGDQPGNEMMAITISTIEKKVQ